MTCAQGLLRLLWGGPEVGVLRDWPCVLLTKILIARLRTLQSLINIYGRNYGCIERWGKGCVATNLKGYSWQFAPVVLQCLS